MRKWFALAALLASAAAAQAPPPNAAVPMKLWRLDCGRFEIDNLGGRRNVSMPVSCYLIRSGDQIILFDAGLEASLFGKPEREEGQTLHLDHRLVDQLSAIGVDPRDVNTLIVSHHHGDHHGQADQFRNARLLMGAADVAVLRSESDKGGLASWLDGTRPLEQISADRDLTGDGRMVVLFTPGHTPGHLSMLVKLGKESYILTGDLVHSRNQLSTRKPSGNHVDKVRGKVEIERVLAIADRNKATILVGHDAADIALMPAFPKAAE